MAPGATAARVARAALALTEPTLRRAWLPSRGPQAVMVVRAVRPAVAMAALADSVARVATAAMDSPLEICPMGRLALLAETAGPVARPPSGEVATAVLALLAETPGLQQPAVMAATQAPVAVAAPVATAASPTATVATAPTRAPRATAAPARLGLRLVAREVTAVTRPLPASEVPPEAVSVPLERPVLPARRAPRASVAQAGARRTPPVRRPAVLAAMEARA